MAVTATGIYKQLELLRLLLAASTTFQGLINAADADEAKKWIYLFGVEEDAETPWTRAIIAEQSDRSRKRVGTGLRAASGAIEWELNLEVPGDVQADTIGEELLWVENTLGAIVAEMEALAGTGEPVAGHTHLDVEEMRVIDGPWKEPPVENELPDLDDGERFARRWWVRLETEWKG